MSLEQPLPQSIAPPRLHWGWVLLLSVITFSVFGAIWLCIQANWAKKVGTKGRAWYWSMASLGLIAIDFVLALVAPSAVDVMRLPIAIVWLFAVFTLRSELEAHPVQLSLGGVMTFFFSYLYFQYFLSDYPVDALGTSGSRARDGFGITYSPPSK